MECPQCGTLERHRVQYLVMMEILDSLDVSKIKMLHFAPEPFFRKIFSSRFGQYETADLCMKGVDYHVDLQNLPFKDAKEIWVAAFEREYLVHLLRKNRGNISHAAREAEIDRKYFRKLMRKYDIEGPRDEPLDDED